MPVEALAEAEVGIPLGLATIVGKVCERGKFLEWGCGSLLTSSGTLSLLSSLSCLCHVCRDSSPRDCCLCSYNEKKLKGKDCVISYGIFRNVQRILLGLTQYINSHTQLPRACKAHGCSSQWRHTQIGPYLWIGPPMHCYLSSQFEHQFYRQENKMLRYYGLGFFFSFHIEIK